MSIKNLPVILSLLAGFVACVATFIYQYEGTSWLWIVIGALVLFYILGLCLQKLFSVVLVVEDEEESQKDEDSESDEATDDTDAVNDTEGAHIKN